MDKPVQRAQLNGEPSLNRNSGGEECRRTPDPRSRKAGPCVLPSRGSAYRRRRPAGGAGAGAPPQGMAGRASGSSSEPLVLLRRVSGQRGAGLGITRTVLSSDSVGKRCSVRRVRPTGRRDDIRGQANRVAADTVHKWRRSIAERLDELVRSVHSSDPASDTSKSGRRRLALRSSSIATATATATWFEEGQRGNEAAPSSVFAEQTPDRAARTPQLPGEFSIDLTGPSAGALITIAPMLLIHACFAAVDRGRADRSRDQGLSRPAAAGLWLSRASAVARSVTSVCTSPPRTAPRIASCLRSPRRRPRSGAPNAVAAR